MPVLKFNRKYDKITQNQLVEDFVERLEISQDLKIKAYKADGTETDGKAISKYKGYKEDGSNELLNPIPDNMILRKKIRTRLIDVIKYILQALPSSLVLNLSKVQVFNIKINRGDRSVNVTLNVKGNNARVYRAYMDRAQLDVSPLFNSTTSGNTIRCTMVPDTSFLQDDFICLYIMTD